MELNTLNRTLLFDTYGEMLTEKQRICFDYRYNQDLALSEIGELEGISRQAVHDNLVRSDALLLEMEEKIGAVERLHRQDRAVAALEQALSVLSDDQSDTAAAAAGCISQALRELKE